jgi:hypothetical protein
VNQQDGKRMQPCYGCLKPADPMKPFKACGICKTMVYCSKACQKKHWPQHKVQCKSFATEIEVGPNGSGLSSKKIQDWKFRNAALGYISIIATTPANASTEILIMHVYFDKAADSINMFQIESDSVISIPLTQADELMKNFRYSGMDKKSFSAALNETIEATDTSSSHNPEFITYSTLYLIFEKSTGEVLYPVVIPSAIRSRDGQTPQRDTVAYYVNAINIGEGGKHR